MKKVLSLVLVLTLVLGSFGMAFADTDITAAAATTPKDVVGTNYEDAVTALSALGVVSGYEDGSYKPANVVTRAEMAKLIIAELGLTANASGAKSTFTDLSGYGWAEGYIGYAQSLGVINGYGDGTFKPGQTVSYDEALTMMVSALGYTKDCKEMNGSWPAIYVQKARVLGLTDDVKAGGAVGANRGDVAIMLYNMLTCTMGYANDEGTWVEKLGKGGKDDPIKVIANLDAEESAGYRVLTKSDADNSVVNIRNYVGAYAKVFTLTKGKNDGDIIAISDCKSTFVTGEYKPGDKVIKAADGTEYKLDDVMNNVRGTSQYATTSAIGFVNADTVDPDTIILTNSGTKFDTSDSVKNVQITLSADLSGKSVKGVFAVMAWAGISDELVDTDDLATIKNNHTLLGKDFVEDDNDEIDMNSFELVGVNALSDIKENNVVYVYANSKDEITKVAVGTETASGAITAIKEGSETKVTIDGKVYLFAGEKLAKNGLITDFDRKDIDTEDEVKVYLDAYGYMYDYDAISGKADNYAIVLDKGDGSQALGSKHEIKLLLADGTDKTFDVDNDIFKADTVTGVSISGGWSPTLKAGTIVKYGVDKDGVIDSFEYLNDGKDYRYDVTQVTNPAINITKDGYYDNTQIRENAVIFSFEDKYDGLKDKTDEDNYGVTTLEKVKDTKDVAAAYIQDNGKISAMLLFDYSGSDAIYGVFTGAKRISGDSDFEASVFIDGVEKTYGVDSEGVYNKIRKATDFTVDGLQKVDFNAGGEIKGITLASSDMAPAGDTYRVTSTIVGATAATFSNNIFKNGATEVKVLKTAVVYKNDGGDFKVASLSDLKNLKQNAEVCFYDTMDDNNDGLMNVVIINNDASALVVNTTQAGIVNTSMAAIQDGTIAQTLANEATINKIADAYHALNSAEKLLVNAANVTALETALTTIQGLKDTAAVIDAIDAVKLAAIGTNQAKFTAAISNKLFTSYSAINNDAYWADKATFNSVSSVANVNTALDAVNQKQLVADVVDPVKNAATAGVEKAFYAALEDSAFTGHYLAANKTAYWTAKASFNSVSSVADVNTALDAVNNQEAVKAVAAAIPSTFTASGTVNSVVMPTVPSGYTIAVKTSGTAANYGTDGKVLQDGPSVVVFTVTHTASSKTADTGDVTVTVSITI